MALSDDVKARVSLVAVAEAAGVEWDRTKTSAQRGDYWASCPFHAEKSSSFHVTQTPGDHGRFYCFGCQSRGSVIDFVRQHRGIGFADAVRALAAAGGVSSVVDPARQARAAADAARRRASAERDGARIAAYKLNAARRLWADSLPDHPAVADYLAGRGIDPDAIGGVPVTLRYHPELPATRAGVVIHTGPAMVAGIGRKGKFVGVHRTWIDGPARARLPDGSKVPKQMLGLSGAIFGSPVMLTARAADLVVGEGIETTLAGLMFLRREFPGRTLAAEAALTLDALAGHSLPLPAGYEIGNSPTTGHPLPSPRPDPARPGWLPPSGVGRVIVLADPSSKCPRRAEIMAGRAVSKLMLAGVNVKCRVPLDRWDHDTDFADLAACGGGNV